MMWKLIIAGIVTTVLLSIVGLGYKHYTGLIEANRMLSENNAKLEISVGLQKETIAAQEGAIDEWAAAQQAMLDTAEQLREVALEAGAETRRLNDIFSKHDLGKLAHHKPGLIERRLNSGTATASRMLECATGAQGQDCPDGNQASTATTGRSEPPASSTDEREVEGTQGEPPPGW